MSHAAYRIEGPALISFSGGRTSGYMLHKILEAWGGVLPPDVHVTFSNTGKEREETLRFVHECATRWGVRVHWLEWRHNDAGFEVVGLNSAARRGEPFEALIAKRQYLPTAITRFCSVELKVRTQKKFAQRHLGWKHWHNVLGLRFDEGHRVLKVLARNDTTKEPFKALMPLSKAKVTRRDVLEFWGRQPFDLGLKAHEGNCDLCFLKGEKILKGLIRANPDAAAWWIEQERTVRPAKPVGARFRLERGYADIVQDVRDQGDFFDQIGDDAQEFDAECGLACGGDGAGEGEQ